MMWRYNFSDRDILEKRYIWESGGSDLILEEICFDFEHMEYEAKAELHVWEDGEVVEKRDVKVFGKFELAGHCDDLDLPKNEQEMNENFELDDFIFLTEEIEGI